MGKRNAQVERMSKYIYPYNPHTVPLNMQGPMHPEDKQELLKEVKLRPPSAQITTLSRTSDTRLPPISVAITNCILDWSLPPNMGRWNCQSVYLECPPGSCFPLDTFRADWLCSCRQEGGFLVLTGCQCPPPSFGFL
jgi:hypothetical protein